MNRNLYRNLLACGVLLMGMLGLVAAQMPPAEGKPMPSVKLPGLFLEHAFPDAKDAKTVDVTDLKGKKNAAIFFTSASTTKTFVKQLGLIRDRVKGFSEVDTVPIAVCYGKIDDLKKTAEQEKVNFTVLVDESGEYFRKFNLISKLKTQKPLGYLVNKMGDVIVITAETGEKQAAALLEVAKREFKK